MTYPFVYKTIARFSDTDLYGVVHHSNYLRWMEEARMQLLEEVMQMSLEDLKKEDIQFPVIHLEGKYIHSIYARQPISIKMLLYYDQTTKLVFTYEILNEREEIAFKGKTEHALTQGGKILFKMPDMFYHVFQEVVSKYKGSYIVVT